MGVWVWVSDCVCLSVCVCVGVGGREVGYNLISHEAQLQHTLQEPYY